MNKYRGIQYNIQNKHFIHFHNPKGSVLYKDNNGELNKYGQDTLVRSFPKGCRLNPDQFAKTVIDHLYERMDAYKRMEKRIFFIGKSTRNLKNLCK